MSDTLPKRELKDRERTREAVDILTPIDHEVAMRLVGLLMKHGATVKQLDAYSYMAKLANGRTEERLCSNHKITFPEGTMRHDGLVLNTSYRFRIVFPDGFTVHGQEQWGMIGGDKTLLFLPETCDE